MGQEKLQNRKQDIGHPQRIWSFIKGQEVFLVFIEKETHPEHRNDLTNIVQKINFIAWTVIHIPVFNSFVRPVPKMVITHLDLFYALVYHHTERPMKYVYTIFIKADCAQTPWACFCIACPDFLLRYSLLALRQGFEGL